MEVINASKHYPDFSLDSINLTIEEGKIVGLIGENGAGKTTLISLILNQIKRDSGMIKVFGLDNLINGEHVKISDRMIR